MMRAIVLIGLMLACSPAVAHVRTSAVGGEAVRHVADGIEISHGSAVLAARSLTDTVLRVRIGQHERLPEHASWAVDADARGRSLPVLATGDGFTTAALAVHVDAVTLCLNVTDRAGKVIVADAALPSFDDRGFTLREAMPASEHDFGLGDKTGGMDRRGGSWGMFLDNTWRTSFDFGRREADTIAIGAPDGPIDYYLIVGPTTAKVVRRYTELTGRAPLPPRWALGYQQSRCSYGPPTCYGWTSVSSTIMHTSQSTR